jgi:aspartate aminotransferase-like enzyme
MTRIRFKEADTAAELQQVNRLNHLIFAEELAQHPRQPSGLLVDRLQKQSRYYVAIDGDAVVGMVCVHSGPVFSITKRLKDQALLRQFDRPLEIRLLAVDQPHRQKTLLAGLFRQVYDFALANHFSHFVISGIATRLPMYLKMGFTPLGPEVQEGAVAFTPMARAVSSEPDGGPGRVLHCEQRWQRTAATQNPVSLMPGPVCIHPRVAEAFNTFPESHRSDRFLHVYERVTRLLNGLSNGAEVALFSGTGTLANDAVAANLKAIFARAEGLILTNGEFGERLANQAAKAGLAFSTLRFAWGRPWDLMRVGEALERKPAWIWAVQIETSTGVLNDTDVLLSLAAKSATEVALDCVSSIGATRMASSMPPFMASGVSGKSLGAYPGLAFVFLSEAGQRMLADKVLCPSFDLLGMCRARGPACTMGSSPLFALARALGDSYACPCAAERRYEEYKLLGQQARRRMQMVGLSPLAADSIAAPNITTFALPDSSFPERCLEAGYRIAHESPYLRECGWGQIATMGNITVDCLETFFQTMQDQA